MLLLVLVRLSHIRGLQVDKGVEQWYKLCMFESCWRPEMQFKNCMSSVGGFGEGGGVVLVMGKS